MLKTLAGQMERVPRRGVADLPRWLTECRGKACRHCVEAFEKYAGCEQEK